MPDDNTDELMEQLNRILVLLEAIGERIENVNASLREASVQAEREVQRWDSLN